MDDSNNSNSPPRPGRVNSIVTPEMSAIPSGHTVKRLELETGSPLLTEEPGEEFVQSSLTTAPPAALITTATSMAMDTQPPLNGSNTASLENREELRAPAPVVSLPPLAPSNAVRRHSDPSRPSSAGSFQASPSNPSDSGSNLSVGTSRSGGKRTSFWKGTYFTTIYKDLVACGYACKLCGKQMYDNQLSASAMRMHLYFDCEHSDAGIRNSVADSCGAVRKTIEKVLGYLYRNVRDNPEPAKRLPQFVRMPLGMRDGSGYLGLLLEAVGGLNIEDTPNKRRRLTKVAEPRKSIYDCTAGEADGITMSLLEAFVDHGWSFSAFDKRDGKIFQAVSKLRRGYAASHYPTREAFTRR